MESTYRFKICDNECKIRTVEIKAASYDAALKELYKKYSPMAVFGNHF